MSMFCRQCEQTINGKGCSAAQGVCGKTETTAGLQDLLVHSLKGIAVYGQRARELGAKDCTVDRFIIEGLFTVVTNVNFDADNIAGLVIGSAAVKEKAKKLFLDAYRAANGKEFNGTLPSVADWQPATDKAGLAEQAKSVGVLANPGLNEDIRSVRELILYGLMGVAAYADHAAILGESDETVNAFFHKALNALVDDSLTLEQLVGLTMELGKVNLRCMEILDAGNTGHFGSPVPTPVPLTIKKGPAIIVSGHDLYDLKQLLEQTDGTGVNVYTHGEMLPAHGYPELKKHPQLAGHFGTAWQNQQKEFDSIPAAVLMTTNCIQKPLDGYKGRIFTTGLVRWPGVSHIESYNGKKDFSAVIAAAKKAGGLAADKPGNELLVGFGHKTILSVADTVISAVKSGALRHLFLIGGCDGAKPGRNYYTELAVKVPKDCVILTLACGKFRFNTQEFGSLGGLPRLIDVGQCNDAYSAIKVAAALAEVFKTDVNGLPLSLILSWYEQKAVCILITLLSLGIKNIRLGPTLPAFITPNILNFLVQNFSIKPVTTPDEDLKAIFSK